MTPDFGLAANAERETLAEVGEVETLRRIFPRLPQASAELLGPGDDAAVLAAPDGRFVVTTDMMIHGPDFRARWSTAHDLGWKAGMTNLADVAAMGARPTALVVAIAAPLDTPVTVLLGIADGLRDACELAAPGCGVAGGDLSVSATLTLAVTAFGDLEGRAPVTRGGARPGDVLAVAGPLGRAGAGIHLLFRDGVRLPAPAAPTLPAGATDAAPGGATPVVTDRAAAARAAGAAGEPDAELGRRVRLAHPTVVEAQLAPTAPIAAGVTAAEAGATAMLDVSDGLVLDARRIAAASGCLVRFDPAAIAREAQELRDLDPAVGDRASDFVLAGGEDHALLATFPPGAALPAGFRPLGEVAALPPGAEPDALVGAQPYTAPGGWDPYADWDGNAG